MLKPIATILCQQIIHRFQYGTYCFYYYDCFIIIVRVILIIIITERFVLASCDDFVVNDCTICRYYNTIFLFHFDSNKTKNNHMSLPLHCYCTDDDVIHNQRVIIMVISSFSFPNAALICRFHCCYGGFCALSPSLQP